MAVGTTRKSKVVQHSHRIGVGKGGARQGAGRKKVGDGILYCRMSEEALAELKQRAKNEKLPVGIYITNELGL